MIHTRHPIFEYFRQYLGTVAVTPAGDGPVDSIHQMLVDFGAEFDFDRHDSGIKKAAGREPPTQSGEASHSLQGGAVIGCRHSGCLPFGCRIAGAEFRAAQVIPIYVGPQIFAADCAISDLFNLDDMLKRDATYSPLTDCARGDTKQFSQRLLASEYFAGVFDCVHAANFSAANSSCQ